MNKDCTVDPFSKIINHLITLTPSSDIPWLSTTSHVEVVSSTEKGEEKEKDIDEGDCEPPSEKRLKQEEETSDNDETISNNNVSYHALQIKTVVINNKKKKEK